MNTLYLDIFSGISGDMFLGAMIDIGINVGELNKAISKLNIGDVKIEPKKINSSGISAIKVDVIVHESIHESDIQKIIYEHTHRHPDKHHHNDNDTHNHSENESNKGEHTTRNFLDIKQLIENSNLSDWVKEKAVKVFTRIAEAEGKIHGCSLDNVHFHEVGAIDSIVDIIGACIAIELLGKPKVICSPVIEGSGFVTCAHGQFPLPAPATLEILAARGIQITQCNEPGEMVTPTGAAIIAEFAEQFSPMKSLKPTRIGYGAGSREGQTRPNVLRAILCESTESKSVERDWETDAISVIETNLDDINSEILGSFIEKALQSGALDVFYTPIQTKKNRPAIKLTLLCPVENTDEFASLILNETTAFGVRFYETIRRKLKREFLVVKTKYGDVRIKEGKLNGKIVQAAPEFEDCKMLALKSNMPIRIVYEEAILAHSKLRKE